jgi:hypothetical protein
MIAGKIHAVAKLYPMIRIRSRSSRKLKTNAPAPIAAIALIAQRYTVPDAPALTAMACVIEVADDPAHGALFCPDLR